MITVKELANIIENGLNQTLSNPEIQFKIWANAGEYQKPERTGNVIVHNIIGNLQTSASSNDANNVLVMGTNGLTLEFIVPIIPPRTNAEQTAQELQKIVDAQYPFIEYIANAINTYFQTAKSMIITETDEEGKTVDYSVAFQAGVVVPSNVSIAAKFGQAITITANIQVNFVQGGVNSQDVAITVDGELMPYQSVRCGRTAVAERDVFSGSDISKCVVSSTVFAIDAEYPTANYAASRSALDYLLKGKPNTAHFVNVKWGDDNEALYFMCFNTVQSSAAGIGVAGLTVSLMEIVGSLDVFNVPESYMVVRFDTDGSFFLSVSEKVNAYATGAGVVRLPALTSTNIDPQTVEYDDETGTYFVTMVFEKAVTVTSNTPHTVIQGGK